MNTDVLAWVLRRVTGKTTSRLMFDYLWSKLGVEQDAYFTIDTSGVEFAGAGLNLTLRDLARFGEMMRCMATTTAGRSFRPVVDDIRAGGNREQFAGAGYTQLPGWSYRRMWWVSHNDHGAFAARGIHGQAVYVDPAAEMVVARFAIRRAPTCISTPRRYRPITRSRNICSERHHDGAERSSQCGFRTTVASR